MNKLRHSGTTNEKAFRETGVIMRMLADLERTIRLLDGDIAAEEERTQVFDISDPLYSMLARTMVARRDNVNVTVAALALRLRAFTGANPASIDKAA
jgi:hypothetical protein